MASFLIRVQLRDAALPTYLHLHEMLARVGVTRSILGDNGVAYDLPWGEYRLDGVQATPEEVRELCAGVVSSVHASYELIVTQEVYSAWWGLQPSVAA